MRKLFLTAIVCALILVSIVAMAAGEAVSVAPVPDGPGVWDTITPLLGPIATILATLLASVFAFFKTKLGKAIKGWLGEGWANSALQFCGNLAMDLVNAAMQTAIKEIEKALADGKISKAEATEAKRKVGEAVLEELRAKTIGRLTKSGAVESAAEAMDVTAKLMESAVRRSKIGGAIASTIPTEKPSVNP